MDKPYQTGYGKPPVSTRFVKGKSGNPRGRPKGSQNIATILMKEARKRVTVKSGGSVRSVSKLEAGLMQLWNKAASGDIRALREALYWLSTIATTDHEDMPFSIVDEADTATMKSLLRRIRESNLTETNLSSSENDGR